MVSLERALSKLGVASRGEAKRWIEAGRIRVDGRPAEHPLQPVNPDRARIEVDGVRVRKAGSITIAMHKPVGYVTTRSDELGRRTVYDLLPPETPFVTPIGRLDFESSGLLLLTNDSRMSDRITTPGACVKVYEVEVDRPLTDEICSEFRKGMHMQNDERLAPVEVDLDPADPRRARLLLREGRNRQIRRMCGERGYVVTKLHRTAVGPILLGDLAEGGVRTLVTSEVDSLHGSLGSAPGARRATSSRPGS